VIRPVGGRINGRFLTEHDEGLQRHLGFSRSHHTAESVSLLLMELEDHQVQAPRNSHPTSTQTIQASTGHQPPKFAAYQITPQ
jgi:hypothetical protein